MKIMSLNVHQFQTEYLMTGGWAISILLIVKKFLENNPDGAVFLYEIPIKVSPEELQKILCPYIVVPSRKNHTRYFYTVAIKDEKGGWEESEQNRFIVGYDDKGREDYANRHVELVNSKNGLKLLGIHAPLEPLYKEREKDKWETIGKERINKSVKRFFDRLKEYAEKNRAERLIIFGDMNVHSKKPCYYYRVFEEIKTSLGYSDLVKDGKPTHFKYGTTLDHVLVSPLLAGSVTARVEEDIILSDHAVIIVDIDI